MDDNTEVLLDLKFDDLIKQLERLTVMYQTNQEELKKIAETSGKASEEYLKLNASQKVLKQEMGNLEKQMVAETKAQKANEGSLVQMRAELQRLNAQYDSMTGFDRMSERGTALQQRIKALSAEIQGLEENTGRWQRNVGNYRSALKGMKDATEAAGLSSQGLDRIMKGLSTNPWMAVVTLLVSILVKLRDRLKDNEQVTASLGKAMSSLQPVFDWFSKALSKIADIFSNVLDWAIEKTIDALGWLGRQLQKLGNLFGKDWGSGLIAYSDTMKKTAEVTTEAAETTETLDTSMRKVKDTIKEVRKELGELIKGLKPLQDNPFESAEKSMKNFSEALKRQKEEAAFVKELMTAYGDLDDLLSKMERESNPLYNFSQTFKENAQTIEETSSSLQSSFGSLSSIYKQMSEDETKSEAEREAAAKKAKQWSALQIAANSGTAIAKGVAASMDKPFPANLAALASTLAAVIAAIAQAKALAKGFETGGVIGGFHGATMGRDNTVASVRTGEMVLNANQQKTLFEIANGGATTSLTASLVAALQAMPAPVVEYTELQRFGNKVNILDKNAKLK